MAELVNNYFTKFDSGPFPFRTLRQELKEGENVYPRMKKELWRLQIKNIKNFSSLSKWQVRLF